MSLDYYGYSRLATYEEAVKALAVGFAKGLRRTIGHEVADVVRRNAAETDPGVCHSHDFCDANVVMDRAYKRVLGDSYLNFGPKEQDLWDAAWDKAKAAGFDPAKVS